ncbi:CDGSH iron-sulfur domain-containing protein [Paeniglutamicibacter gangotriensis]|nr:CDGSH iron-sulfur domain-containing protein [Paeniglutamicibacter gangotriensis]
MDPSWSEETFRVLDAEGNAVPRTRETVALCRCGGSAIKPWCHGTHKLN